MFNKIQLIINIFLILIMFSIISLAKTAGDKGYYVFWLYGGPIVLFSSVSLLITIWRNKNNLLSFITLSNIILNTITLIIFSGIIILGLFFNIYIIG